ncbi:MAG: 30S ribosomal protein S12 methylthiotransferase RimO [Anaerolineaceae bacterium]|nr:30S ribosomal protein S12 methylthiotransferase RimO [Anaerolineaceae bacterium]
MKKKPENTFHIISLGCAKNLVDSHSYAQLLRKNHLIETESFAKAKFILVNTCGFIHDAREESYETVREAAKRKKPGQKLVVTGCLSERYKEEMLKQVEGIDGLIGTRNLKDLATLIAALGAQSALPLAHFPEYQRIVNQTDLNACAIQGASAYLKIADGCRRTCAYCAIPNIKGSLVSRPLAQVIEDALFLQAEGVQEINLIAQDPTDYGLDLYGKPAFTNLLEELLPQIAQVPWVRILYAFPGFESKKLTKLMLNHANLLHYLDLPLQHASPKVLKSMLRPSDIGWVRQTIKEMRQQIPDLVVRTTFIVGFPTETEADFQMLKDFVKEMHFDHFGVFTYSPEEGTPAASLGDPIPHQVKEARRMELMEMQSKLSFKKQVSLVGKEFDMIVEGSDPSQNILIGRNWRCAPEVDGLIIAKGAQAGLPFTRVRITGVTGPDLYAEQIPDPV